MPTRNKDHHLTQQQCLGQVEITLSHNYCRVGEQAVPVVIPFRIFFKVCKVLMEDLSKWETRLRCCKTWEFKCHRDSNILNLIKMLIPSKMRNRKLNHKHNLKRNHKHSHRLSSKINQL